MRPPADPYDTGPLEIDPLGAVLAGLLRTPGARAAHVVDSRRGVIVAELGSTAGYDGAAIVQLARAAAPVAARVDALDDMVVTTRGSVHLLRECDEPGTFLHVRLDREYGDVAAARRALRVAGLQQAVQAVRMRVDAGTAAPAVASPAPRPARAPFGGGAPELLPHWAPVPLFGGAPEPLSAPERSGGGAPGAAPARVPAPVPPPDPLPRRSPVRPAEQQPALVTLTGLRPPPRAGALAVLALQEVEQREAVSEGAVPQEAGPRAEPGAQLPRRLPSPRPRPPNVAGDGVLKKVWAEDLDALQRVLAGLRRLA